MTLSKLARAERTMDNCPCSPGEWVGRIESDDYTGEVGASTWVCPLNSHQDAARQWVELSTGRGSRFVAKAGRS